jgi:hypothetical protein
MNAKELTDLRNRITGAHNGINAEDLKLLYDLLPVVDSLSRSRIRDTSTEPPTKEDAGRFDGMQEQVLAMNYRGHFVPKFFEMVRRFPEKYPKWTCVPQLPEAPHDNT